MEIKTQRTILKHGDSSLCVTLPFDWLKSHNLKQGDKLNIVSKDKILIIRIVDGKLPAKVDEESK